MRRLLVIVLVLAAAAAVVRSRQRVEVWHTAADAAVD